MKLTVEALEYSAETAATMAAFYAVGGIGRIIGAFSGGLIWSSYGIKGICLISGSCSFLALAALAAGLEKNDKPG